MGAVFLGFTLLVTLGVTAYLVGTLIRSIQKEKSTQMSLWKNFGLSPGFCFLFNDTQDEAVSAGRKLARTKNATLHIHTPNGEVRDSISS